MTFHTQQIQTEQGLLVGLPLPEWQKLLKNRDCLHYFSCFSR